MIKADRSNDAEGILNFVAGVLLMAREIPLAGKQPPSNNPLALIPPLRDHRLTLVAGSSNLANRLTGQIIYQDVTITRVDLRRFINHLMARNGAFVS
jgi:hypothetical protein